MPGRRIMGVDVGATKLLAGAVDSDFFVHRLVQRSVSGLGQASLLRAVTDVVGDASGLSGGEIEAIGLALPGPIDGAAGRARTSRHRPAPDIPLADVMAERLGLPVFADDRGNLAALAEYRAGAARGVGYAVVLIVGASIRGGVIAGGELYRGASGTVDGLGHITIDADGPPCPHGCNGRGCLTSLASGTALAHEALQAARAHPDSALARAVRHRRVLDGALVSELAHDGDAIAGEVIALIGTRLGAGIATLVNVLDPEVVVVGGGVVGAGELLLGPARAQVARRALRPVSVVAARLGVEAGMIGAAALAFDALSARDRV